MGISQSNKSIRLELILLEVERKRKVNTEVKLRLIYACIVFILNSTIVGLVSKRIVNTFRLFSQLLTRFQNITLI